MRATPRPTKPEATRKRRLVRMHGRWLNKEDSAKVLEYFEFGYV